MELLPRGNLTTSQLLETCTKQTLPNGDCIYTSKTYLDTSRPYSPDLPFQLMVNPRGQAFIEEGSNLLALADSSYYIPYGIRNYTDREGSSRITKDMLLTTGQAYPVSVKRYLWWAAETGLSQFSAVRKLKSAGIFCPDPILATRWRLISDWINSQPAEIGSQRFLEYGSSLAQVVGRLKEDGLWDQCWQLDPHVDGDFFVRDLQSPNPLARFYAIDPIKLVG